jgi:hypothetical protein
MHWRALAILLLFLPSGARGITGYSRDVLWSDIARAEAIAVVEVQGTSVPPGGQRLAHVRTLESLKGKAPPSFQFPPYEDWSDNVVVLELEAPYVQSPRRFPLVVLLGLRQSQVRMREQFPKLKWPERPVLPFGVIEPLDAAELRHFRARILEAVAIQRLPLGPRREADRLAWTVRSASNRATRGHALYGFADAVRWQHAGLAPSRPASPLSRAQKRALMKGFVAEPTVDETFPQVLALVEREPDASFDRLLVSVLDFTLSDGPKVPRVNRYTETAVGDGYTGRPSATKRLSGVKRPRDLSGWLPTYEEQPPHPESQNPESQGEAPTRRPPEWTGAALFMAMERLGVEDREARVKAWLRYDARLLPTVSQARELWQSLKASGRLPAAVPLQPAVSHVETEAYVLPD